MPVISMRVLFLTIFVLPTALFPGPCEQPLQSISRIHEPVPYFAEGKREGTVTLYRGVDAESFESDFKGEDALIWTSRDLDSAIGYAALSADRLRKRGLKRVLILKMTVPKKD